MSSSSRQIRVACSALLLTVQVLGLGHVVLAPHTVNNSGALVDVQPLGVQVHHERASHVCAEEIEAHPHGAEDCLVVAAWSAPRLVSHGPALPVLPTARAEAPLESSVAGVTQDVLSRAPKSSPPVA